MNGSEGSGRLKTNRRRVLQAVSGLTTLAILSTSASTVAGEPGDQQWVFETGRVYSSPTISDGTVFVGSRDRNLHAVEAKTGKNSGHSAQTMRFFHRRQ
jgi:outer membrane protein assembly factor BamB